MKALSLLQPWASLVMMGVKTIETRCWQTPYRGELLIHASLGKKGSVLCGQPPFSKYIPQFHQLPFGAIIGSVTLQEIVPVEDLKFSASRPASQWKKKLLAITQKAGMPGSWLIPSFFSSPFL